MMKGLEQNRLAIWRTFAGIVLSPARLGNYDIIALPNSLPPQAQFSPLSLNCGRISINLC